MGLRLEYKGKYKIIGDEYVIRELFLIIVQENVLEINSISEEVSSFDTKGHIKLTDYSLLNLTKFVEFLNKRIRDGKTLYSYKYLNEAKKLVTLVIVKNFYVKKLMKMNKPIYALT